MKKIESLEILTTAWCPFNCKYCYIPKTPMMSRMHNELVKNLNCLIEEASKINVKHVGFWGTEPTLTLDKINIEKLLNIPDLETVSFSTSMMYNPQVIRDFILKIAPRKIKIRIQVSLDGPNFITDKNRMKGASEKIPSNLQDLISSLQNVDLGETAVEVRFKSTLTIENLKEMNKDQSLIDEYVEYFVSLENKLVALNSNKNITIARGTYCPTMMVPGKYTSTDGKIFSEFIKNCYEHNLKTAYHYRLRRVYDFAYELHKKRMFTCSGGDSNFGFDGSFHICHRSFYLNKKEYIDSVLSSNIENWDVSHFRRGNIDLVNRYICGDPLRMKYVLRGHHDFWKLDISMVISKIRELLAAKQISPAYQDERLALKFAIFTQCGLDCPMESLLNCGSIHLVPVSLVRLFCNGAFEELDRRVLNEL